MGHCNKCSKSIKPSDIKSCSVCHSAFHYQCLAITAENFSKESKVSKSTWKCSQCKLTDKGNSSISAMSPVDNTGYPVSDSMVSELKSYFNKRLEDSMSKLRRDIQGDIKADSLDTRKTIVELTESINFLSIKYDEIKELVESKIKVIEHLEARNRGLTSQVHDLNLRLAQIEQSSRDCNLEIQCVPEHKSENLRTIVQQLLTTVNCNLANTDIVNYHRVAKVNRDSTRPRSIIVKLPSPLVRDQIISAVKTFNSTNITNKLSSAHLGLAGANSPVFVTEHLSPLNKQLHAAARKTAKEKKYEFVWIRNGRIYMRKDKLSKSFVVRDINSLDSLN